MTQPTDPTGVSTSRGKRLGWFLLLWAGGVAAVGAVGYGLKALLGIL